jgi:hypothetical protein
MVDEPSLELLPNFRAESFQDPVIDLPSVLYDRRRNTAYHQGNTL